MQEKRKSGTQLSLNQVYKILEQSGIPEDESVEFLKLPWLRNVEGNYEAFPVIEEKDYSTETYKTKRMFFDDVKELIRIATIFKKFYEKELIRNAKEFNDFWIYANGNAVRLEEFASELEIVARANQQYRLAFERKNRIDKGATLKSKNVPSLKPKETPPTGIPQVLESKIEELN